MSFFFCPLSFISFVITTFGVINRIEIKKEEETKQNKTKKKIVCFVIFIDSNSKGPPLDDIPPQQLTHINIIT